MRLAHRVVKAGSLQHRRDVWTPCLQLRPPTRHHNPHQETNLRRFAVMAFPGKSYDEEDYERLLQLQSIPTVSQVWVHPAPETDSSSEDSASNDVDITVCTGH